MPEVVRVPSARATYFGESLASGAVPLDPVPSWANGGSIAVTQTRETPLGEPAPLEPRADETPVGRAIDQSSSRATSGDEWTLDMNAPHWTMRKRPIGWRVLVAVLLVLFAAVMIAQLQESLPGETAGEAVIKSQPAVARTLLSAAKQQASTATEAREKAEVDIATELRNRKRAANEAATAVNAAARRAAATERRTANRNLREATARRTHAWAESREAAVDVRTAMQQLAAAPSLRTTDGDLVRVAAIGLIALISLIGAVALVAPRSEPNLSYSVRHGKPTSSNDQMPRAADQGRAPAAGGAPADTGITPSSGDSSGSGGPSTSVSNKEPIFTQAIVTSAAMIAGLFGIQATEGLQENLLNLALPLVPVGGAFFARRKVAALANLDPAVRAQFGP